MKKILTLLCCAMIAFSTSAQNEFLDANKKTDGNEDETLVLTKKTEANTTHPVGGITEEHFAKISIANKTLSYNFNDNTDRTLNLYGVSGKLIKSATLAQQGSLTLNDLHHGVYIYEMLTNGKRTAAHKFVIR